MSVTGTGNTRILCSACLLGLPCQYDGQVARRLLQPAIRDAIKSQIIPVCPEQLAGLPTPRPPAEIVGGDGDGVLQGQARVLSASGEDFSLHFLRGAELTLSVARLTGATAIITQKRSPSCSCAGIYDGTFSHVLRDGLGVCAALLRSHGLELWDVDVFEATFIHP